MTHPCPTCGEDPCGQFERCRYPYTHHGPAAHGSKLFDYLISKAALRQGYPELFVER